MIQRIIKGKFITLKVLFLPVTLLLFIFSCGSEKTEGKISPQSADSIVNVRIAVTGDLMCHSVQFNYARVDKDNFDFNPVFRYIRKYLNDADFTFGNLETVTAGKNRGFSGYPFFNSPDEFISALSNAGFDLLTTSNNHSLDQGEKGVLRTIEMLNKNNICYNGTYISQKDRDSVRVFNIKGIKTAFLSYSYGTNGNPIPKGKNYLINIIDTVQIREDISNARKISDMVIVHYHFGEEYKRNPTQEQQLVVNKTIEYGADIIIGGHPHVIEHASYFETNNAMLDTGYVIYSMGNFLSNQRWRYSDAGVIVYLNIEKNFTTGKIRLTRVDYTPTWVFKGNTEKGREYIILPSSSYNDRTLNFLNSSERQKMRTSFEDTKEILRIPK